MKHKSKELIKPLNDINPLFHPLQLKEQQRREAISKSQGVPEQE